MVAAAVIGSGVIGAGASIFGASQQAGAAKDAAAQQMAMYQQTRSDLQPFMQGGAGAFSQLQGLLGLNGGNSASQLATLRNSPGYQFAFDQGLQGIDRSAASRGLLLSGGQLKDATTFGQGQADQLYNNYANQLMGASTLGANAAAGVGTQGTLAAGLSGQATEAAGTALGSGATGVANQLTGVLQNQNVQALIGGNSGEQVSYANGPPAPGSLVPIYPS